MNIEEIKKAVDKGLTVHADTDAYIVIKDSISQYLIHFTPEPDNYIGLHGRKGSIYENKLNGRHFYVKLTCGHSPTPDSGCGTGYGRNNNGDTFCYACCHINELEHIKKTGLVFAYLSNDADKLTVQTWFNSVLSNDVRILSHHRDNFSGDRTYLRFKIDNYIYSGFSMGFGMYLRAKRTKLKSLQS